MSEILLVGEDNPYGQDPRFALYHKPRHASGNRLRQHLGLRDATYERLQKINLCTKKWSLREARERAQLLTERGAVGGLRIIVLLGAKVRDAFGLEMEFFGVLSDPAVTPVFVLLPHPSGLNRLWNQPGARERAQAILRRLMPSVPWGEISPAETAGSGG